MFKINKCFKFEGKQEFDTKLNTFNKLVQNDPNVLDFQLPICDYNLLDNYNKQLIDYIDCYKHNTRDGQLKYKLNLELIFFTELKSLRLNYNNKIDELNTRLANCQNQQKFETELNKFDLFSITDEHSIDSAINSSDNLTNSSNLLSKLAKEPHLAAINSVCLEEDEERNILSSPSSNLTNITSSELSHLGDSNLISKCIYHHASDNNLFDSILSSIELNNKSNISTSRTQLCCANCSIPNNKQNMTRITKSASDLNLEFDYATR